MGNNERKSIPRKKETKNIKTWIQPEISVRQVNGHHFQYNQYIWDVKY